MKKKKQLTDTQAITALFMSLGFTPSEVAFVLKNQQLINEVKHLYRL